MSLLRPEMSIGASLATVTIVYAIFNQATPSIADIRVAQPGNTDVASSEKLATWTAASTVAAISLIAKDANIFIFGGMTTIVLAWWHRHANQVNPSTGKAAVAGAMKVPPTTGVDVGGGNAPPMNYTPDFGSEYSY